MIDVIPYCRGDFFMSCNE